MRERERRHIAAGREAPASSRLRGLALMVLVCLAACAPLIAPFSLEAYKNATSLKAETLALIAESDEPFAQHKDEVRALKVRLAAAREFAAGMSKNRLSTLQWDRINDPATGIVGRFFTSWEAQGAMSETFIEAKRAQAARAFDGIICLEANKEKDVDCLGTDPEAAADAP